MQSNNDRHYHYHYTKKTGNHGAHHFIINTVFSGGGVGRAFNDLLNHDSSNSGDFEFICNGGVGQPCFIHTTPPTPVPPLLNAKAEFGKRVN